MTNFPELDPDDNEVRLNELCLNGLADITSRWRADEITSGQATAEIHALRTRT